MGTQFPLSPELTEVADHLRGLQLPASRVDRDQLFYEAGLAAALSASRQQLLPWKMTSGVLAASVLVLATFLMQLPDDEAVVASSDDSLPTSETPVAETNRDEVPQLRHRVRHWPESASLLTLRDAALRMELPEPKLVASSEEGQISESRTARELLRELLPQPVAPASTGSQFPALDGEG